jgi:NADH:ubiquinone oxidoreductase subunit 5 (subunit L)/multisubunit Na+/H+ antiporter MnhA subunit
MQIKAALKAIILNKIGDLTLFIAFSYNFILILQNLLIIF